MALDETITRLSKLVPVRTGDLSYSQQESVKRSDAVVRDVENGAIANRRLWPRERTCQSVSALPGKAG